MCAGMSPTNGHSAFILLTRGKIAQFYLKYEQIIFDQVI
jgi:hypothetical protein